MHYIIFLFISDPTPNRNDTQKYVVAFMKMKKDGHRIYFAYTNGFKLFVLNLFNYQGVRFLFQY